MSATPAAKDKKAPAGAAGAAANRRSTPAKTPTTNAATTNGTAADRSPSRMAAQNGTSATASSATSSPLNRARSVRNSAPVSARGAARKPPVNDDSDDAKAELQAKLDELQEKLNQSEIAHEASQKQTAVVQIKLDEARKEQGMLEEQVHEHTEKIEELENDKKESQRAKRELEQIYSDGLKEREEAKAREEEMQASMQKMRESFAQREMRDRNGSIADDERRPSVSRNSSFRNGGSSPNPEAAFAPPSSVQRSDSRSSSRLVMQKDKMIESLRLELAEAQIKLVEFDHQGGGRAAQLEREMYEIKMQNGRLMEENESFQLLLQEKTLSGDFQNSDLLRLPATNDNASRPPSRSPGQQGASLADELDGHDEASELTLGEPNDMERRLQSEVNSMKDQNKALTLYINNIISRLLQHEQFEQILDKTPDLMSGPGAASSKPAAANTDKELPPPPPPKDDKPAQSEEQGGGGFLSRAKSVIGGGRPKSRPQSQIQQPSQEFKNQLASAGEPSQTTDVHSDPNTAPSIPLGRSASSRNAHRRSNSEWPAASVVTNMYRGPSPGLQGPTSPGLTSPKRNSFFSNGIGSLSGAGTPPASNANTRHPSNPLTQTIAENEVPPIAENLPPPITDTTSSDAMRPPPKRSSPLIPASHNPAAMSALEAGPTSTTDPLSPPLDAAHQPATAGATPASPPRSTTSSNDRESRASLAGDRAGGGAVMMGSKPRPLRLVQDEKARKEEVGGKRASWFAGWMGGGTQGDKGGQGSSGSGPSGHQANAQ